jgi:threonyl-tRNA synthetase
MANLDHIRHSLAHLLASAALEHDPKAKLGVGPVIENGFYYDIQFSSSFSDEHLPKLEARMRELVGEHLPFERIDATPDQARAQFEHQPFKTELIEDLEKEGAEISLYQTGSFIDLCRGGHVENTQDVPGDAFRLTKVAGSYWRGDDSQARMTRIYGVAFADKTDLDAYLTQMEEAEKRDHRKVGKELDLFTFSELVGPGLPLWTPRGTIVRSELDAYVWELRQKHGYNRVTIPHITKRALYETSGHWEKYGDDLFKIRSREDKEYALKPMNCPHHAQLFDRHPHSYRQMPQRYAETTMVYRDEQSGELGGLTRVLSITQDDSHVFCRHSQVKEEFFRIWDIVDTFYGTFGFNLRVRLSFHDSKTPEKYLGTPEIWKNAEDALRDIAKERGADSFEAPGEAAIYGPKLDFMAKDSIGREHQVATIQLDMLQPERFNLTCVNEKGEKERVAMIHCAVMGSIERFTAVLLEHTGGSLPLFLSPVQVQILPVKEVHEGYAQKIAEVLKEKGVRVELSAEDNLGKRIRAAKVMKVPYVLVVGDKEMGAETVTLEHRDLGKTEDLPLSALVSRITEEIAKRA